MVRKRRLTGATCCFPLDMNEDNARFGLLAALILVYLLCGAAVFSALERPSELRARHRWQERLENFTQQHDISLEALRGLLRQYEEANVAGIRVDALRPRWDFAGAFYFVGTVVSTIGELKKAGPSRPGRHTSRPGCRNAPGNAPQCPPWHRPCILGSCLL